MRGSKPHKHVWIAHCQIPHPNGHVEKFISGVFAERELAARVCREEGEWGGHGPFEEARYDFDGDIYLYDKTGNRRYTIQRHEVEIDGSKHHSLKEDAA
jgi:hypothetical protein